MKHLLIVVYFIVVMLVSGLTQAQPIPSVAASVTYAQFNLIEIVYDYELPKSLFVAGISPTQN